MEKITELVVALILTLNGNVIAETEIYMGQKKILRIIE